MGLQVAGKQNHDQDKINFKPARNEGCSLCWTLQRWIFETEGSLSGYAFGKARNEHAWGKKDRIFKWQPVRGKALSPQKIYKHSKQLFLSLLPLTFQREPPLLLSHVTKKLPRLSVHIHTCPVIVIRYHLAILMKGVHCALRMVDNKPLPVPQSITPSQLPLSAQQPLPYLIVLYNGGSVAITYCWARG